MGGCWSLASNRVSAGEKRRELWVSEVCALLSIAVWEGATAGRKMGQRISEGRLLSPRKIYRSATLCI